MAKVMRPCPKCHNPLAIPQPPPECFMCPKCGVLLKPKSHTAQPRVAVEASAAGPPRPAAMPALAAANGDTLPAGGILRNWLIFAFLVGNILVILTLFFQRSTNGIATVQTDGTTDSLNLSLQSSVEDKRSQIVKPHIDKGLAYLVKRVAEKKEQETKDGDMIFWGLDWERGEGLTPGPAGVVALLGLTLLECNVSADDADILWLAEVIEKQAGKLKQTRATAMAVMFLCRWHQAKPLEDRYQRLIRTLTLRLIAGQLEYGAWPSDLPLLNPSQENQLVKGLNEGTFKPTRLGAGTASNTNFAIQALWLARKHDLPVRESLIAAAGHFQRSQRADGGWNFSEAVKDRFLASSTCAGLIALAMEKAILDGEPRPFIPSEKTADVHRAFIFLDKSIGENGQQASHDDKDILAGQLFMADSWGDIFFLWAVARLASIYDRETIDGKDWYDWGYKTLLAAQNADNGSWNDRHGPLADTCFALLFLKKSNFTRDLTAKLKDLS